MFFWGEEILSFQDPFYIYNPHSKNILRNRFIELGVVTAALCEEKGFDLFCLQIDPTSATSELMRQGMKLPVVSFEGSFAIAASKMHPYRCFSLEQLIAWAEYDPEGFIRPVLLEGDIIGQSLADVALKSYEEGKVYTWQDGDMVDCLSVSGALQKINETLQKAQAAAQKRALNEGVSGHHPAPSASRKM